MTQTQFSPGVDKCIAIVICNRVIEDVQTHNKTLVDLFNCISAPRLPAIHPRICFVAALHGAKGDWNFKIRLTSPSGKTMFDVPFDAHFEDPRTVLEIGVDVAGPVFEEEGTHFVHVMTGFDQLAERPFNVTLVPEG